MTQRFPYYFPGTGEPSVAIPQVAARLDCRERSTGGEVRLAAAHVFKSFDPEFAPSTISSAENIHYAQELRQQLRLRYPERPEATVPPWCVDAD